MCIVMVKKILFLWVALEQLSNSRVIEKGSICIWLESQPVFSFSIY